MLSPSMIRKLDELPDSPGVYLYKNEAGEIIYVGKALSLRNRVRQYFQAHRAGEGKVSFLVEEIRDVELVVVDSEKEAWLLESSLIRKYQPKYNTSLKDDKQYPFLRLTVEEFPRLTLVRRVEKDGARYFGPYIPASSARAALTLAQKFFQIRWCSEKPGSRARPCLDYYIHRCLGPCSSLTTADIYGAVVRSCTLFLEGKHDDLLVLLREQMARAAEDERFEDAAQLRDMAGSIEASRERQKMIVPQLLDQDLFGHHIEGCEALVLVFNRRRGIVVDRREFITAALEEATSEEFLSDVVLQYYHDAPIPSHVLVPEPLPQMVEEVLSERAGRKVHVSSPTRGEAKRLIDLVLRNARQRFRSRRISDATALLPSPECVDALQRALSLERPPLRIEGFDISHLAGTGTVGSLVTFENGRPLKSGYRRFHVRSVRKPDDVSSIREIVFRRYKRVLEEGARRPDLVLIDGGRGQLDAALMALCDAGIPDLTIAALAKRNEAIFVPGTLDPLKLSRDHPGLQLLQRVRDEAHRFALSFQRKTREKGTPLGRRRGRPPGR